MVYEFYFNPKQIRVSLGIGRKTYLPVSVPSVFVFKPEEKNKKENLSSHIVIKKHLVNLKLTLNPLILNALVTCQILSLNSQKTDNTSKLLAENESLRCKIEHLEIENRKLKEENIKLKSHSYNFDNV